ncbi:hypothetical protein M8J76_016389 [Diaphorina citri]|nr:hypothetical protein M8J76_016389 [Diaphorina citri]
MEGAQGDPIIQSFQHRRAEMGVGNTSQDEKTPVARKWRTFRWETFDSKVLRHSRISPGAKALRAREIINPRCREPD